MVPQVKIYLLGDQTYDVYSKLRELLHSTRDPVLNHFFESVDHTIRDEIGRLPHTTREELPQFSGVADLLSWHHCNNGPTVAFDMALTCILQLGIFIQSVFCRGYYTKPC